MKLSPSCGQLFGWSDTQWSGNLVGLQKQGFVNNLEVVIPISQCGVLPSSPSVLSSLCIDDYFPLHISNVTKGIVALCGSVSLVPSSNAVNLIKNDVYSTR